MSLKDRIKDDTKQAMRDKDEVRLGTLRMLSAAIQRREVDERITLDDMQVIAVIEKQIKQARESIELYEKGGRADLAEKEKREMTLWQTYMPQALSEAEVDALIGEAIAATSAASMRDMGKVMGLLKSKIQGRADMGALGAKIKAKLGG
jgi:uncharacterized protein YqeY